MYVSRKMRLVEAIPGLRGGEIKGNDSGAKFDCDIL
jgi:hypothetical protein